MRTALVGLLVLGLAATADANGRDPYGVTINFRPGNEQQIVIGTTFGLIVSKDGGATWQWMCETAIGYAGMYDPDYAYSSSGAIFATTFDGLKVMRDGCNFVATPPGMTFASKVERGPDGAIYFAAADSTVGDSKVYKSTDDGMSFPTSATPGKAGDWWWSIATAPSNAMRVYLTGFRLEQGNPIEFLLFTSTNGGTSFTAMPLTGIAPLSANAWLEIAGVDHTNDQVVYLKVKYEDGTSSNGIYKWNNAGQSWTKLLSRTSNWDISFLVRKTGGCVVGTREGGPERSTACDTNWTPITTGPKHIGCLFENTAGEIWACTQNYDVPELNIMSDGFGLMKTTDFTTWTPVLKYQDIEAPVPCAPGTLQEDRCVQRYMDQAPQWCCLVDQLKITDQAFDCEGALKCAAGLMDNAGDGTVVKPPPDSCCGTMHAKSSALLALLVAAGLLLPRRRTKER